MFCIYSLHVLSQNGRAEVSGEVIHDSLRESLKTPPSATTLRVNTIKYQLHDAQAYLSSYLSKQVSTRDKVLTQLSQILKLAEISNLTLNLLVHSDVYPTAIPWAAIMCWCAMSTYGIVCVCALARVQPCSNI